MTRLVPLTAAHLDDVMRYEDEVFGTESWTRRSYLDELADTHHRHYLAAVADDGTLLGWAGSYLVGDTVDVLTVGTVPAARRQGVGRLLVQALLADAHRRGAEQAFLEVRADNDGAQALYATLGFAPIGRRPGYYDGGRIDAVTMRRALSTSEVAG